MAFADQAPRVQTNVRAAPTASTSPTLYFDTGYRPGVDNCPFVNAGSAITDGGECNGQSVFNIWYFKNEKSAHGPLFSYFNDDHFSGYPMIDPKFWFADAKGYRLTCVLQNLKGDGNKRNFWDWLAFRTTVHDQMITLDNYDKIPDATYYSVVDAMKASNLPQLINVYLRNQDGTANGHAVVAYAAGPIPRPSGDGPNVAVYVDDPNCPYDPPFSHKILAFIPSLTQTYKETPGEADQMFPEGGLLPYSSSLNAESSTEKFSKIQLMPEQFWLYDSEIKDKFDNIEHAGDGDFPYYTIEADDDAFNITSDAPPSLYTDTTSSNPADGFTQSLYLSGRELKLTVSSGLYLRVYDGLTKDSNGNFKPVASNVQLPDNQNGDPDHGFVVLPLKNPDQIYGVEIDSELNPLRFVDFRWLRVVTLAGEWAAVNVPPGVSADLCQRVKLDLDPSSYSNPFQLVSEKAADGFPAGTPVVYSADFSGVGNMPNASQQAPGTAPPGFVVQVLVGPPGNPLYEHCDLHIMDINTLQIIVNDQVLTFRRLKSS